MKTGAFSASARVAAFLTGLSALTVDLVHKPGREMINSDYNSRHPNHCTYERCKICKFAYEMESVGDSVVYTVHSINANDVDNGLIKMPHSQRPAWKNVQSQDHVHRMLLDLVRDSKIPEKKKRKGDFTRVKRLHNLYRTGQVKIDHDGFVTVKHTDAVGNVYYAISVPANFYPGLVQALHIKLNHPSKSQLLRLMSRHFYCAGQARIIEEITSACTLCASLRELPKELFSQSTTLNPVFGATFSADVIKKDGQLVFLCREKLSQFTFTKIISDETADSLRDAIVAAVIDLIPETGTMVQVDCAPGLQTLAAEAKLDGSILKKLGITIDLGRVHNVNKNPVAENAIKEFHKERLKLNPAGGRISEIERSVITKNMNSRVRERGLTPKEMAFNRDQVTNEVKPTNDDELCRLQVQFRTDRHPNKNDVLNKNISISVGDNVFLKADKSKLRGREAYKVTKLFQKNEEEWATILKCENKFMSKEYLVKTSEIFKIPGNEISPVMENEEFIHVDKENSINAEVQVEEVTEEPASEDILREESTNAPIAAPKDDLTLNDAVEIPANATATEHPAKRKKRQAAIKFGQKMKEILPCLRVKKKDPSSLHGWLYEDWLKVIDDDPFAEVAAVSVTTAANTAADDVPTEPNSEATEEAVIKDIFLFSH